MKVLMVTTMLMLLVLNAKRVQWVKRLQRALKVKVKGKGKTRVPWAALSVPRPALIAFR